MVVPHRGEVYQGRTIRGPTKLRAGTQSESVHERYRRASL